MTERANDVATDADRLRMLEEQKRNTYRLLTILVGVLVALAVAWTLWAVLNQANSRAKDQADRQVCEILDNC